jgi:uncharacterized protein YigA (DUF484 family)
MNQTDITEDDIADYLLATPDFFIRHAELLARIQLTHPHSGRAISLADRQIELQRERYKALETKHMQLFHLGKENVGLANKLHQWMLGLLTFRSAEPLEAIHHLCSTLQSIFEVPEAAVDSSQAALGLAAKMQLPTCGLAAEAFFQNANVGAALQNASAANSLAVIPMPGVGLLVLASHDANRFTADMGTEFLTRLGQLAHAALS